MGRRSRAGGERGRVAGRVRAILAVAAELPDGGMAPEPSDDDARALRWLPSDDLTDRGPPVVRPPARDAADPRPYAMAHRPAGLMRRLVAGVPVRADPGRRGAIAVGVAVVVAAALTGGWVLASRPRAVAVGDNGAGQAAVHSGGSRSAAASPALDAKGGLAGSTPGSRRASTSGGSAALAGMVVVDVAGKVRRPGLYRLPPGSRVDDAVRAAGGVLPAIDISTVNLAARLADGQQIVIGPTGGMPGAAGTGSDAAPAPGSSPVDLNSATLQQLESLPGVGPVLGQNILDWREAHGRFATVDQLRDVAGIGDRT